MSAWRKVKARKTPQKEGKSLSSNVRGLDTKNIMNCLKLNLRLFRNVIFENRKINIEVTTVF